MADMLPSFFTRVVSMCVRVADLWTSLHTAYFPDGGGRDVRQLRLASTVDLILVLVC